MRARDWLGVWCVACHHLRCCQAFEGLATETLGLVLSKLYGFGAFANLRAFRVWGTADLSSACASQFLRVGMRSLPESNSSQGRDYVPAEVLITFLILGICILILVTAMCLEVAIWRLEQGDQVHSTYELFPGRLSRVVGRICIQHDPRGLSWFFLLSCLSGSVAFGFIWLCLVLVLFKGWCCPRLKRSQQEMGSFPPAPPLPPVIVSEISPLPPSHALTETSRTEPEHVLRPEEISSGAPVPCLKGKPISL